MKDETKKYLTDGIKRGKHLDFYKMLKEINDLVETDFCFDMNCKQISNSKPYTQAEAKEMARLLGNVYSIVHCISCHSCQIRYLKI